MKKIIPLLALTTTGIMLTGCSYTIEKIEPADYQSNLMEFREHIDNLSTIDEENFSKIAFNKYKLSIIENDEIKLIDNNVLNSADSNNANDLTKNVENNEKILENSKKSSENIENFSENREILKNNLKNLQKNQIVTNDLTKENTALNNTEISLDLNNEFSSIENNSNLNNDATIDNESVSDKLNTEINNESNNSQNNEIIIENEEKISTLYSLSSDIEDSTSEFSILKTKLVEAIDETQNLMNKVRNNEIELTDEGRTLITEQTKQLKELGKQLSRSTTELAISLSDISKLFDSDGSIDMDTLNFKYMIVLDNLINGNEMLENSLNSLRLINSMFNMDSRSLPPNARGRIVYGFRNSNQPPIMKDYIINNDGSIKENLSNNETENPNNTTNTENNLNNTTNTENNLNNATNNNNNNSSNNSSNNNETNNDLSNDNLNNNDLSNNSSSNNMNESNGNDFTTPSNNSDLANTNQSTNNTNDLDNTNRRSNIDTYQNNRLKANIDTYQNTNRHNIDSFFNTALLDNEFMYGNNGYGYGYMNPNIMQYQNYENINRNNHYYNQNQNFNQNNNQNNNTDNLSNSNTINENLNNNQNNDENTTNSVDNNQTTQQKQPRRKKFQKNIDTYRDENTPTLKSKFEKFKQSVKGFFSKVNPNDKAKNPIYRFTPDDLD